MRLSDVIEMIVIFDDESGLADEIKRDFNEYFPENGILIEKRYNKEEVEEFIEKDLKKEGVYVFFIDLYWKREKRNNGESSCSEFYGIDLLELVRDKYPKSRRYMRRSHNRKHQRSLPLALEIKLKKIPNGRLSHLFHGLHNLRQGVEHLICLLIEIFKHSLVLLPSISHSILNLL